MSKTSDFFQCLICNSFFESLWKVETHVKGHNEDEKRIREGTTDNGPRRRGMLPIQKRTFHECYVPVVKNQIDPDFLAKYENVLANDGKVKVGSKSARKNRELSGLGVSEDLTEEDILNSSVRRPRRGNLQAKANIRKTAAILTIPDQGEDDDDSDSDQDYIESLLEEDSEGTDDKDDNSSDYEAYFCKKGRKRGRPLGSYTVTKDRKPECKKGGKRGRPLGSYTVTKNPEKGRNIGRPLAIYTLTKDRKPEEVETTSSKPKYKKLKRWLWDGKDHPFKCDYCEQSFPKRMMLPYHIVREHKDVAKTIDCPISICDKTCVNYWTLQAHVRYHLAAEHREVMVKEEILRVFANSDKKPDIEFFRRYGGLNCQYCLVNIGFSLEHLEKHKNTEHGENVVLKCPGCEESFQNSVADLISHVRSLHPSCLDPYDERLRRKAEDKELELRFRCDKCGFKFKYDYQLKKHEASHENGGKEEDEEERPFKCPSCNKAFKQKNHLSRHFMLHLENNPFVCDFTNCNRKFNSHYNLRRHKLLHSQSSVEANRVYCPICNQCVSRKDRLAEHMKNIHKPEDIVNGIPVASSFVYKRRQVRMPHMGFGRYKDHEVYKSIETPTTNNQAEPSSSSSVSTSKVQEQNSIVKSEQMKEIHLIDKILLTENGTAIHIKGEHLSPQKISEKESTNNIKLPRLNCDTVDDTFSIPAKTPLNITQLITNDPIFKTLDPKSAEVKDILTRSRNYHNVTTGSKSFTCTECNAIFTRAWSLQLHLKSIHKKTLDESTAIISRSNEDGTAESAEGERSSQVVTLMCGTCAYVAKDSKDLQNHMETSHNYGLTHRCNICGIHLRDKQRLQRHIKEVHMGPRNHLCKYCKKGFASSSKRRTHEFTQHEQPPQERKQCPICHKHFSHRSIVAHIKIHKTKSAKEMEKLKCQLCQDVFSCRASLKRHIDCVHLGKPFNIIHHRKYAAKRRPELKSRAPEEQAKKTKGDGEWFRPLLDKVEELPTRKLKPDEPIPKEASEDSALSILGF
ncbi:unnamed protein product [Orchesella dallaii]|uniref:C2H2-type domain-containing protein n=1 Tax=Orchesella dallaii TaxID=48710 RepID=A0ABP1R9H3_9HEXA